MDKNIVSIKCIYPVWISMTTIPSRMENTYKIINGILSNVSGFDRIVLNIPYKYKRFNINEDMVRKFQNINDTRFTINRTQDYGPITKILPTLDIVPRESIILICDDDCYHYEAFKIAAEAQERERSKSFTFWRYRFKNLDIPQGVDIITFWRPNMNGFQEYANRALKNKHCFYVDDMIIGGYLSKNGIKIEQLDRKWKWPWIPNCFNQGSTSDSLYGLGGSYSRKNSSNICYKHLN